MTTAKAKLVSWCNAQVGTHEGENNYNKYAADPRITKLLGWNAQNQPWCDIFTDEAYVDCFGLETGAAMTYQQIGKGSALCSASAQFFKNNGAWYTTPEDGDVVFFYVSGGINHQGIVVAVSGTTVTTVEGNSSDKVSKRTYNIGDSSIAGYGRPKWSLVTGESTIAPSEHNWKPQTLKYGAKGVDVYVLQSLLIAKKFFTENNTKEIDGDYGAKTQAAVNSARQFYGMIANGECDKTLLKRLMEVG